MAQGHGRYVRRHDDDRERIILGEGSQASADPPDHVRERLAPAWTETGPHDEANVPRRPQ